MRKSAQKAAKREYANIQKSFRDIIDEATNFAALAVDALFAAFSFELATRSVASVASSAAACNCGLLAAASMHAAGTDCSVT